MTRGWFSPVVSLLFFLFLTLQSTYGTDKILQGQTITHPMTIMSSGGNFELGFFSPGNTSKYYLGIWYKVSNQTIVWVANRDDPFLSDSCILTINSEGQLVISHGRMSYQVTNITTRNHNKTFVTLLDSGDIVLQDQISLEILWQSFDYPTNTILPGMNLGHDAIYGNFWSLVSWRSPEDPALGSFSLGLNTRGALVVRKGYKIHWTDSSFEFENYGGLEYNSFNIFGYVSWGSLHNSGITHMVLDAYGQLKIQSWSEDDKSWYTRKSSKCSNQRCGAFSVCNIMADSPCSCLTGFRNLSDGGCERKTNLPCNDSTGYDIQNYGFYQMKIVDFPSDPGTFDVKNASACESACLRKCSCIAYSFDEKLFRCLAWFSDLFDIDQATTDAFEKNFYLKLPLSELNITKDFNPTNGTIMREQNRGNKMQLWTIVILTISLSMLMLGLFIHYVRRKLQVKGEDLLKFDLAMSLQADDTEFTEANMGAVRRKPEVKLPLFSFASVSSATDNFSATNKLGEGGFGPVYKGILLKGDEVAVKRLSKRSGQGWEELKNEALVIAKLQHKNLVRLLGCCIEKDEKILIYEYMPNKSLDFFLFDSIKRRTLNWKTRVYIVEGIAQGLLYLHQYSRLRIIHRDLKASNILLDNNMNPKISDFGMARIFGADELQANTNRIVGTYGYMSPEYAFEGRFSIKSDVFSFGVLLLEIVSGKKNTGFYQSDSLHLLGYAWDLWISNRGMELIDPMLEKVSMHLAMRYINIGLLCVQEKADDRPTMSDVVPMLNNESMTLLSPKQPAFLNVRSIANPHMMKSMPKTCSINDVTFSAFEPR
ncbi:hypothetical protein DITRI_Ditri15bG0025900 [Diplodiscus trichospermus]